MIIIRPGDVPLDEGGGYHGGSGSFSRITFFDGIKESAFNYARDITIPPGTVIGIHQHEKDEEIFFFISGEGVVTVADEEEEVGPGTLVLTLPGHPHGVKNTGNGDLRFFAVNTKHCSQ
jgi:mannose-6-phosphate isomerase-like protein (cupin superfamily)